MTDKIHSDFQSFAFIMTERFDNTQKNQSNYYLREESKKQCREETIQNKADKLLTSLQRDNQSRRQAKKIELSWNLTFTKLFCNRDSTRFTSKYELSMLKILKSIIFNLSAKIIIFYGNFFSKALFFVQGVFFCTGAFFVHHCTKIFK